MVRKFTRPPKAPIPDAAANATGTDNNTAGTANNPTRKQLATKPKPQPTKRRPTPPQQKASSSGNNNAAAAVVFDDEPRISKRMRLPHRPYQAPEPIPMKILQMLKSEDEVLNNSKQDNKATTAKSPTATPKPAPSSKSTPTPKSTPPTPKSTPKSPAATKSQKRPAPDSTSSPKRKKSIGPEDSPTTPKAKSKVQKKKPAAKENTATSKKSPKIAVKSKPSPPVAATASVTTPSLDSTPVTAPTPKVSKKKAVQPAKLLVKKARVSIKNSAEKKQKKPKAAPSTVPGGTPAAVPKKIKKPKIAPTPTANGVPFVPALMTPVLDVINAVSGAATTTIAAKPKKPRKKKTPGIPGADQPDTFAFLPGPVRNPTATATSSTLPFQLALPPLIKKLELAKKGKKAQNLTPRETVTKYETEPTFESALPIPFISTVAQSKLLIRATRTGNTKLLEKLLKDKKEITSLNIPQSLSNPRDAAYYAIVKEDLEALKQLMNPKMAENLGPFPDSMMEEESSGKGSYMQFGHGMRAVTVARGGKEGNNALTKDTSNQTHKSGCPSLQQLLRHCLDLGKSKAFITKLMGLVKDEDLNSWVLGNMNDVFLHGHHKLGGELVTESIKRGGYGFNELHKEALTLSNNKPFSPFKSVSVVKKATGNSRVTPIHLAAINPDPQYLIALLAAKPDFSILDTVHRTPLHYAAVCSSPGPISFLLSRGISPEILDREGKSPLYLAAEVGRPANVDRILRVVAQTTAEAGEAAAADISGPFIDRPCRSTGLSSIHIAAENGHDEVIRVLLAFGANSEKTTPAQHDKLTALMIAAQYGHLNVVKILVEEGGVTVDAKDKRGRSALTHAVIDGNAHIVSYLLRLGADNTVKDTSGNTLVHYAAAYGWYFNWKLLLESGCPPNEQNDWKMTPVAIAFMKGHIGLVSLMVLGSNSSGAPGQLGVDINAPVNYSNGMTLLHQTCANPGELIIQRIKFLVETQGADVGVLDYEKNTALHYLVQAEHKAIEKKRSQKPKSWYGDDVKAQWAKETKQMQENISAAAKLLLLHNGDPQKLNLKAETPVTLGARLGCFDLVRIFLNSGKCEQLCPPVEIVPVDQGTYPGVSTILHNIVDQTQNKESGAVEFYKYCLKHPKLLAELKPMARKVDQKGYTPLQNFLRAVDDRYSGSDSAAKSNGSECSDEDEDAEDKVTKVKVVESSTSDEESALDLLKFLVNTLESDVDQLVEDKTKNSALHIIAQIKRCTFAHKLAEIILAKKPKQLDPENEDSRTPLLLAVSSLNESVARVLLNAGANPNFKSQKDEGKSIMIIAAETATTSFNLVQLLVEKGANVRDVSPKTGNSVLHLVAARPGMSGALEAIRKIVATGKIPAIAVNKLGRTALHLAVNARGGETDVSYDVEDLLIEIGSKALTAVDARGRLPLHFAFVKIGKHKDSTFIDPIELVAILTRAMKDASVSEKIHAADEFRCTPLHYAAQRGATISSSLLINEARNDKNKINPIDANGNTPYGLAVLKGHEGCALYFQQSHGDFMLSLNSIFKDYSENEGKEWRWRHSVLLEEYEERKLQERSKYPILQEVVRKDWQGLLHLMLEKLKNSGAGVTPAIEVAIKTNRLKLAMKLVNRVKNNRELALTKEQQSLLHTMAKCTETMNAEFSAQLVQSLVLKGIGVQSLDTFRATPFIYAAQNLNSDLCLEFGKYAKLADVVTLVPDKLGRTPFSALFWNINSSSSFSAPLKAWAEQLLANGAKANILCHYPITLSTFPVTRSLVTVESLYSCKMSPLILVVIQGNYEIVKWLLGLNKAGKPMVVDPNYPDELGRTPMIHAARLNDVKMVKLLLNPKTYDPEKDVKPWNTKGKAPNVPRPDPPFDLKVQDRNGWTVIHHLVAPLHPSNIFYFNSDTVLRLLATVGAPLEAKSVSKQTPLNLARQLKVYKLATVLQTLLGIHDYSTTSNDELEISSSATPVDNETTPTVTAGPSEKIDFGSDSAKMAEKLIGDQMVVDEVEVLSCEPDSLSGMTRENSEVVLDETQQIPYDCLLTQVDLAYGLYGLYNFYKMQVIKEKHGKELIILFTRWGRVGDTGQFQKTPFPTAEEATKEFRKIFRAKSGNSWEAIKSFAPVPKKYRLVNTEHKPLKKIKKNPVKVDFVEIEMMGLCTGSNIPSSVFELFKILCLSHRSKVKTGDQDKDDNSDDYDENDSKQLPFGALNFETLKQGDKILDEISKLLVSKEAARKKSTNNAEDTQYAEMMNLIIGKSEEFYSLIPVYGFQFEKLSPLFTYDLLRPKQERIHSLVHLGVATQLFLGAQLGMKDTNPFDYIYKAVGTKIELLDQSTEEAQLILQYIEDTSEAGRRHQDVAKIRGIYKVQRPGEVEQIKNVGIGNKWLLWHGTKTRNLLSILHQGLQAVPLGTELCGHMFGKGIYFADTFEKSRGYCQSGTNGDYPQQFMFLCEVALGNVQNVDFDDITDEQSALKSSFDSLKTCNARMIPDPGSVIYWNGAIVPLGKRIENIPEKEDEYFCLENNEYIIFNTSQVRLRYLVQF